MKLSEIKEELLSDAQCEALVFRGIEYSGEKAEAAVILGTNTHAESRAIGSAKLYLNGGVKKLISSGNPAWDFPEGRYSEAEYMKLIMVREGVPAEDIIVENQALTTLENMTYSLKILENTPGLLKDSKFILITSGYHMYRSLLLARQIFKGINIIPYPVWEDDVRPETWRNSEYGTARVRNEVHFLIKHAKEGLIEDVEAPSEIK
ncbi:MAG: YdcF family protein [Clostridia bacterium]|nr:YdcF family protein [Clostridia bacterium]